MRPTAVLEPVEPVLLFAGVVPWSCHRTCRQLVELALKGSIPYLTGRL